MEPKKKIYKSTKNKKLCGVCGGLAEYFNVDVTWIRLIFAFLVLCVSFGLWAYIVFALVLPKDTEVLKEQTKEDEPPVRRCICCGNVLSLDDENCSRCGTIMY